MLTDIWILILGAPNHILCFLSRSEKSKSATQKVVRLQAKAVVALGMCAVSQRDIGSENVTERETHQTSHLHSQTSTVTTAL